MPTKDVLTEELYEKSKEFLKESGYLKDVVGILFYLIQVFDALCICLAYENTEVDGKGERHAYSSSLTKYAQSIAGCSYTTLNTLAIWRNDIVHKPFNYDAIIRESLKLLNNLVYFERVFNAYSVELDIDELNCSLVNVIKTLQDASKKKQIEELSKLTKCPECNMPILKATTGATCTRCNWEFFI